MRNFRRYRRVFKKRVPKNIYRFVKKQIDQNIENKLSTQDLHDNFGSLTTSYTEKCLTQLSVGPEKYKRIGNIVRIRSLEIYGALVGGASGVAADDPYNVVRIIVGVYNSGTLTPLGTAGYGISTVIRTDSDNAVGQLTHKILDKYVPLQVASNGTSAGFAPGVKIIKFYKRFKKPIVIKYDSTVNTSGSKQIIMSVVSDSTLPTHPGFEVGYVTITFEDA